MKLIEKISTPAQMKKAWRKLSKNPTSRGLDRLTIAEFGGNFDEHSRRIRKQLRSGTYKFEPLKGVVIPRAGNKTRLIKISTVSDRLVQKSIQLTIQSKLQKKYELKNPASYAYLEKRGISDAVEKIREFYSANQRFVLEADIKSFFDEVNRDKLLEEMIFPTLPDDSINDLIKDAISSELGNKKDLIEANKWERYFPDELSGIPQGSILSPLFSNVYLSSLDKAMLDNEFNLVRYADDFIVLCESKDIAIDAYKLAVDTLSKLELEMHDLYVGSGEQPDKYSEVTHFTKGFNFIGLRFIGSKIYPSPKAINRMNDVMESFPGEATFLDDLHAINRKVNTWGSTYRFTNYNKKHIYEPLNRKLTEAFKRTIDKYGLQLKKPSDKFSLMQKIGIKTFDESYTYHQSNYLNRKSDEK